MYAIVKSGGKQYRVSEGDEIDVELQSAAAGDTVELKDVFLVNDGKQTIIGNPVVEGYAVSAEVVGETLGPKIHSVKFKQRHVSKRKIGHRQHYTRLKVKAITKAKKATKDK